MNDMSLKNFHAKFQTFDDSADTQDVPARLATPPPAGSERKLLAEKRLESDRGRQGAEGAERLSKAAANPGAVLVPTEPNPIDAACRTRPAPPHGAIVPHDLEFAGEPAVHK